MALGPGKSFKRFEPSLELSEEEYAQIVDYTDRPGGEATGKVAAGVSWASVTAKGHFDHEARRNGGEGTQKRVVTVNSTHSDDDGESSGGGQEGPWLNVIELLAEQRGGMWTSIGHEQSMLEHGCPYARACRA